jgi:hypothetical protein
MSLTIPQIEAIAPMKSDRYTTGRKIARRNDMAWLVVMLRELDSMRPQQR